MKVVKQLEERPKLTLKITPFEYLFNGITLVLFISSLIYLISVWGKLPTQIPAHYNAVGEVDRWGNKWEMIVVPLIALALWSGMAILEKYPHVYNYTNLTKENIRGQYLNARLMLHVLKNTMTIIFTYLIWKDVQVALEKHQSLGPWFIPIFFIAVFLPMGYFIVRSYRLKK